MIPTSEHKGLKDYAIKQIQDSINFDCNTSYYEDVKKETVEEYKARKINGFESDLLYHTKKNQEEIDSNNQKNSWIKQLRDSLK